MLLFNVGAAACSALRLGLGLEVVDSTVGANTLDGAGGARTELAELRMFAVELPAIPR